MSERTPVRFLSPGSNAMAETTSSGSTSSSAPTANSTITSSEPGPVKPDDNPDGLSPLMLAAQRGDLAALDALLLPGGIDVDQVDAKYGSSALMFAAEESHHLGVARLLKAGANVNFASARSGFRALEFAVGNCELLTVELLLAQPGLDLNARRTSSARTEGTQIEMMRPSACVLQAAHNAGQKCRR